MKMFLLIPAAILIFSTNFTVEACMATSSASDPVVSSTVSPSSSTVSSSSSSTTETPLNVCSPELVTFGTGDNNNPQILIDVTYSGYSSTPIANTMETISTMTATCSAIDGYNASMQFNQLTGGPRENMGSPQTINIILTCDSQEQTWVYSAEVDGTVFSVDVNTIQCRQANNNG